METNMVRLSPEPQTRGTACVALLSSMLYTLYGRKKGTPDGVSLDQLFSYMILTLFTVWLSFPHCPCSFLPRVTRSGQSDTYPPLLPAALSEHLSEDKQVRV